MNRAGVGRGRDSGTPSDSSCTRMNHVCISCIAHDTEWGRVWPQKGFWLIADCCAGRLFVWLRHSGHFGCRANHSAALGLKVRVCMVWRWALRFMARCWGQCSADGLQIASDGGPLLWS